MSLDDATRELRLAGIRQAVSLYDRVVQDVPSYEESPDSADFLRKLFPELDDLTLAGFAAYICINALTAYASSKKAGEGIFILGLAFGERTKRLAWSLLTPEADHS